MLFLTNTNSLHSKHCIAICVSRGLVKLNTVRLVANLDTEHLLRLMANGKRSQLQSRDQEVQTDRKLQKQDKLLFLDENARQRKLLSMKVNIPRNSTQRGGIGPRRTDRVSQL